MIKSLIKFGVRYTDLKKTKGCNFGKTKDKILRTPIVLGIFDKATKTRFLRGNVALSKVVLHRQLVERTKSNRKMLTSVNEAEEVVHSNWIQNKMGNKGSKLK